MVAWSAVSIAIAFAVLVAGVLWTLRAAERKLSRIAGAAESMQAEASQLMRELRGLSQRTADIAAEMQAQLAKAGGLLSAAGELGDAVKGSASAVNRIAAAVDDAAERHMEQAAGRSKALISDALHWAELGWSAWRWLQSKQTAAADSSEIARKDEGHDKIEGS